MLKDFDTKKITIHDMISIYSLQYLVKIFYLLHLKNASKGFCKNGKKILAINS